MPGELIQRWVIGNGGFIGEVSLFVLAESDHYIKGRSQRHYVELSNLYVHPKRRGRGWARELLTVAIQYAREREWIIFIRAIPYGKDHGELDELLATYRRYGFRSRKSDPREMVLR